MFFTILGLAARETFQMTVNQTGGNPLKAVSGQSRPTISFLEHQDARLLGRDRETARTPINCFSNGRSSRAGKRKYDPPNSIHHRSNAVVSRVLFSSFPSLKKERGTQGRFRECRSVFKLISTGILYLHLGSSCLLLLIKKKRRQDPGNNLPFHF